MPPGVTKGEKGKGAKGKATRTFSLIVRARGACQMCGSTDRLQCAHIVDRVYSWTRTVEENAWCLCIRCHFRVDKTAYLFMDLVEATIGRAAHDALWARAKEGRGKKFDWDAEVERLDTIHDQIKASA